MLLAFVLAFFGAVLICGFQHWHEYVLRQGLYLPQITSLLLTPIVFFLMFLLVALLNPVLHRVGLGLHRRELVLVAACWLVTGAVSSQGFAPQAIHRAGQLFGRAHDAQRVTRDYLPDRWFVDRDEADQVYRGFEGADTEFSWREIPWRKWLTPLSFWLPFLFAAGVFSLSLAQVVHRQWSRHELLPYPLAEVAWAVVDVQRPRAWPRIFYSRVFWTGFLLVFAIYLVNGLSQWFPQVVSVPLRYNQRVLEREFPFLSRYGGTLVYSLFRGWFYPFIVGIAVLISAEMSLSCWAGYLLMIIGSAVFFLFTGIAIQTHHEQSMHLGMYVGMTLMILYYGRREYTSIVRQAFLPGHSSDPAVHAAAAACRRSLCAFALLVALLYVAGLDWLVALALVTALGMVLLLGARAAAEAGLPWLAGFSGMATAFPLKFMGPAAIGPRNLAVLAVIGGMLSANLENNLAAQQTTCAKLAEGVFRGQWFHRILILAMCVSVFIAVGVQWRNVYRHGGRHEARMQRDLRGDLERAQREIIPLQLEGHAQGLDATRGLAKLPLLQPDRDVLVCFAFGAALVAACGIMRLRFVWWPLHPLPLLFANTWAMSRLYPSFFLGWVIKTALVKIGGGRFYQASRPFFIGVIFGNIMGAGIWYVVAALQFWLTGREPPQILFFV